MLGTILYGRTVELVGKISEESNIAILEQSIEVLEQRINEIEMIVSQQMVNKDIQNFLYKYDPFRYSNTYSILETRKHLYNYKTLNNFILDYFVFFNRSELVMSHEMTYTYKQFYDMILSYDGIGYEDWRAQIKENFFKKHFWPSSPVKYYGKNYSVITYMQSIGYSKSSNGCIMVLIDNNEIQKLLEKLDVGKDGWWYITDHEGRVISSISSDNSELVPAGIDFTESSGIIRSPVNGKDMLISYASSTSLGWRFVAVQPSSVVMAKVEYIKSITITIIAATLILGIIVAYFLANKNTRPIKEIINRIVKHRNDDDYNIENEYDFIQDTISQITEANKKLQVTVQQQKPFLTSYFFGRLFRGEFNSKMETDALLKHIGLNLDGEAYVAIILKIMSKESSITEKQIHEFGMKKVVIREILKSVMREKTFLYDIDENKIGILFVCDSIDANSCKKQVEEMLTSIIEGAESVSVGDIKLAVGGRYKELLEVARSFNEARQALGSSIWSENKTIIWYTDLKKQDEGYFYPVDIESRLTNLAKAGNKAEVKELLAELYEENIMKRELTANMLNLFIYEMWATIIKLIKQISLDENTYEKIKTEFENMENISEINKLQSIMNTYYTICDVMERQKQSRNTQLKDQIVKYINETYMDNGLSLVSVAYKFNLSEAYLSHFFKEQMGENFSTYLENLRMEKSMELLKNTDLPINVIADRVGYSSSATFCRAFRRKHGVNATAFRNTKD